MQEFLCLGRLAQFWHRYLVEVTCRQSWLCWSAKVLWHYRLMVWFCPWSCKMYVQTKHWSHMSCWFGLSVQSLLQFAPAQGLTPEQGFWSLLDPSVLSMVGTWGVVSSPESLSSRETMIWRNRENEKQKPFVFQNKETSKRNIPIEKKRQKVC